MSIRKYGGRYWAVYDAASELGGAWACGPRGAGLSPRVVEKSPRVRSPVPCAAPASPGSPMPRDQHAGRASQACQDWLRSMG